MNVRLPQRVRRGALLGGTAVIAAATFGALAARVDDAGAAADDPERLVEQARKASVRQTFNGLLALEWRDGGRIEQTQVYVHVAGGSIQLGLGPSRVDARGLERWTGDDAGWHELWKDGPRAKEPRPGASWTLDFAGYGRVGDRQATRVVAFDPDTGDVVARFWIDSARGILLRRDVVDRNGDTVRSARFLSIDAPGGGSPTPPPRQASGTAPKAVVRAPDGYPAPERMHGYELIGRYRHQDGAIQLFYSDGLFNLSLFEQSGDVDWDALPTGAEHDIEDTRTRSYTTPTSTVFVWGQDGITITCVGDAPAEELRAVVRSVHEADERDTIDDIADFVLAPFDWD